MQFKHLSTIPLCHLHMTPLLLSASFLKENKVSDLICNEKQFNSVQRNFLFIQGYDMEDAMILNNASYERGFAHASIYKSEVGGLPLSVHPLPLSQLDRLT